jgi:mRNA interferase RelE/StbE
MIYPGFRFTPSGLPAVRDRIIRGRVYGLAYSGRVWSAWKREVNYDLRFKPRSVKDLKKLPAELRRRIIEKVEEMTEDSAGDVKQLTNSTPEYRLRVGDYRVLFEIEGNTIVVYRVRHRREAYR